MTKRPFPKPVPDRPYQSSIGLKELHRFKSQWPCHGFPNSLARIVYTFEANGDLVDVEYLARNGRALSWPAGPPGDGPAYVALCLDAQRKVHPQHAKDRE